MSSLARAVVALVAALAALPGGAALACGCFTPPTVNSPVVQAGERILFTVDRGQVNAFLQIQYSGSASEFGWLLPLPSLPTLEVGTDEMFNALQTRTEPRYILTRAPAGGGGGGGCASSASGITRLPADASRCDPTCASGEVCLDGTCVKDPALVQSSVGPYDFAVLKADDKQVMLDWLAQNRFFVPDGTGAAVTPYIHPGAFFLALKLKAGESTGSIQPVVVHYASDLPMIPIVLTSVGAVPHMGILVWLLGNARAIPRNYHHVVLDDVAYDWVNGNGASYDALVARAVFEAPAHHAFVTEYAGPSSILSGSVAVPVFEAATFARITDLVAYLTALRQAGFAYPFAGPARAALAAAITEPAELVAMGVTPDGFYANLDQWVQSYAATFPTAPPIAFDPVALSTDLDKRAVAPLRQAQQTFAQFPALTRLHTVLSPEDMTEDPVFSENPDLPQFVGSVHSATLSAGSDPILTSSDTGLAIHYPGSLAPANLSSLPGSLRIEVLRESGAAMVSQGNAAAIAAQTGLGGRFSSSSGCRLVAPPAARGQLAVLALLALLAAALRRRATGAA